MIGRSWLKPERQGVLAMVPVLAGALVVGVSAATTQLTPLARGAAIGFLVAAAVAAFALKRRDVRTHASVTCAIVAVTIAGQTRTGAPYVVACAAFAAVALACLRAPLIAARSNGTGSGSGSAGVWGRLLGTSAIVIAALVAALPVAGGFAEKQIQRWAGNVVADDDAVGFATNLRIGSLRHLLQSDRVLMRIEGERVEYLRGVVLDDYDRRIWSSTEAKSTRSFATEGSIAASTVHIELSRAALAGQMQEPRWFLPSNACDVRTPSGRLSMDPHGMAHPDPPNDAREIWFSLAARASCKSPLPDAAAPTKHDLVMAQKIREELRPIAIEWTQGTANAGEALAAIMKRLGAFDYSLEDRREGSMDPVFEFLTVTHRGHCELFASALALLARTVGIPTRVVAGFHVDEVNSFTGLAVVRDRNAHAWVEAWLGDRWVSLDPTPPTEVLALAKPSRWENFAEAVSLHWDRTIGFFANIGLARAGIFAGVTAVVLIIVRRFLRRRGGQEKRSALASSRPLPAFEILAAALARAGWVRTESEPLERFARRVDAAGEPWSADVADALARYADLRYGGIGEERTIVSRLEALARTIVPTT